MPPPSGPVASLPDVGPPHGGGAEGRGRKRFRGIERHLCLVLIAFLLLTHLALSELDAQARRGKSELRLPSIPQLQELLRRKLWHDAIDSLASGKRYKAVARKLKEVLPS